MACQDTPIKQLIRGHHGSFVFGTGEKLDGFDFVPERPQVTRNSKLKATRTSADLPSDTTYVHFKNWIEAMLAGDPSRCNCDPKLGAAAVTTVILGARSYREGKVLFFDEKTLTAREADSSWADNWEKRSRERGKPNHIPGWTAGDHGSLLEEPAYRNLAGPWVNGIAPERS